MHIFDVAVFFGESHSGSVIEALKACHDSPHRAFNVAHIEYPLTEQTFFSTLFKQAVTIPVGARGFYISMLGGNAHNILGLVRRGKPYDFILPGELGLDEEPGSEPQTYAFVRSALHASMAYDRRFLQSARTAVNGSLIHLQSPPPVEDDALILTDLHPRLKSGAEDIILAPPMLRYKLWRLHSNLVADTCADLGIEYVPVPDDAMIDGRFLRPELFQDATHANERYGNLVLQQVEEKLRS